jgi:hypothetical protein
VYCKLGDHLTTKIDYKVPILLQICCPPPATLSHHFLVNWEDETETLERVAQEKVSKYCVRVGLVKELGS